MPPKRKGTSQPQEQVTLGPQVVEGENVFGVAHIFASFNDTFVHITDLSGRYVLINVYRRLFLMIYRIGFNILSCCHLAPSDDDRPHFCHKYGEYTLLHVSLKIDC